MQRKTHRSWGYDDEYCERVIADDQTSFVIEKKLSLDPEGIGMSYLSEDIEVIKGSIDDAALSGKNILITGTTGLIGSIIAKSIIAYNLDHPEKRVNVYAMARSESKVLSVYHAYFQSVKEAEEMGIHFLLQDICTPIRISEKCDYIIHTANPTVSKYFMSNPVEVMDSIYTGTKNILEYAKKMGTEGMVYLSSMEVFGSVNTDDRIRENELGYLDISNIRSCYSEGKRLVECMCKSYSEEYGVPVRVARLAQTFGAGVLPTENRVFAQFARSAVNGEDIVLHTTGESVGNYCYTTDAIRAIFMLLTHGTSGEAYTVVNEEMTMQIRDMAKLVIDAFSDGRCKLVFDIPESNVFGYAPQTKMKLSGEKLRNLGWQPKVGMLEAYKRMIPDLMGDRIL